MSPFCSFGAVWFRLWTHQYLDTNVTTYYGRQLLNSGLISLDELNSKWLTEFWDVGQRERLAPQILSLDCTIQVVLACVLTSVPLGTDVGVRLLPRPAVGCFSNNETHFPGYKPVSSLYHTHTHTHRYTCTHTSYIYTCITTECGKTPYYQIFDSSHH